MNHANPEIEWAKSNPYEGKGNFRPAVEWKARVLSACREHPGKWAILKRYKATSGGNIATLKLRNPEFDFTSRVEGQGKERARVVYVMFRDGAEEGK